MSRQGQIVHLRREPAELSGVQETCTRSLLPGNKPEAPIS